jgi:hypothetical protein
MASLAEVQPFLALSCKPKEGTVQELRIESSIVTKVTLHVKKSIVQLLLHSSASQRWAQIRNFIVLIKSSL